MEAPYPPNEPARLEALRRYKVLDTKPEGLFDDLTRLAAAFCQCPTAVISFGDSEREWIKSRYNFTIPQIPRAISFCAHGMLQNDIFIIEDTLADERFADNPLVVSDPHLRFYAGKTLLSSDGYALGALCVGDVVPRQLSADQIECLRALGRQVVALLERRALADAHVLAFSELGHKLSAVKTPREAGQIIVDTAQELLGWDASSLDLYSPETGHIRPVLTLDTLAGQRIEVPHAYTDVRPGPMAWKTITEGAQLILREGRTVSTPKSDTPEGLIPFGDKGRPSASLLFVPIRTGLRVVGVLTIQSYTPNAYQEEDLTTLQSLADHCGGALERIHVETTLHENEQRFRALIENSSDAVALLNPDGIILYGSPATTRILGYELSDFVGKSAFELVHPDDHPVAGERLREAMDNPGKMVSVQARVRHQNGSWRLLEGVFNNLIADPSVGAIVNNYRDITERKQMQEQLLQAQKMEGIGRLAGGVAHDFNNLLTAILGYTDLSLGCLPPGDAVREYLGNVEQAAQRAANLTQQLLAFARRQVIEERVIDLNALIQNLEKMLRPLIGENIELALQLGNPLGRLRVDPGLIEQVLVNLIINSRDAMPEGGRITIETQNIALDKGYAEHHAEVVPGDYIRLSVIDTGIGMTPEVKARIFEPFFTTKGAGKGTGLGLATCYGIIKQSGGHIWVYSEPERGTIFRIYLPQINQPLSASVGEARTELPRGTETILLVEDEPLVRDIGAQALRAQGYRIWQAGNGLEALEVVQQQIGPLDLLLTDVIMPVMGGRELAARLQPLYPGLKVLYCSGYTEGAIMEELGEGTGRAFLQKPFQARALVRKVREVLDS